MRRDEFSRRLMALSGEEVTVVVLRKGAEKTLELSTTGFDFGDRILGMTDPPAPGEEYDPFKVRILARDPRSGKWHTQARSLAGLGAASPLVYLDANGNGIRDADEKPLEGAGFQANRASTEKKSSASGTALLTGLPTYQEVDVGIAVATLEDPLAVPERPGVRFVPRPGHVTPVDFPVLISGEVTGTVRLERGGEKHEASGVVVQLVDLQGTVAKEVRTAYDGFYDITLIVPGQYDIRVSPRQAERLKLKPPAPRRITIEASGTILDGIDLLVEGQASADSR